MAIKLIHFGVLLHDFEIIAQFCWTRRFGFRTFFFGDFRSFSTSSVVLHNCERIFKLFEFYWSFVELYNISSYIECLQQTGNR